MNLKDRQTAYRGTFCGDLAAPHPLGRVVLDDLRKFCGIDKGGLVVSPTQRMTDPYATVYRAAQRDVYLRIVKMIGLDIATEPEATHVSERTDSGTAEQ